MGRKDEQLTYALENYSDTRNNDFNQIRIVHHSLRSVDFSAVDMTTKIGNIVLETPFFINAMTGGSEWTKEINAKLAYVAKHSGLAMAVGSMSVAMSNEQLLDSFKVVREINPDGIVFANLNPNFTHQEATRAVELLGANGLQIHLNSAQEVVMSEGDTVFNHWSASIESILRHVKTDVIIKEVGFGMSKETIEELLDYKARIIDVSGSGGTNFVQIENERRKDQKMGYLNNWGQSTVQSLLEAKEYKDDVDLIASGGIRHPLDMIKAYVLGAKATGLSGVILNSVMNKGVEETLVMIESWKKELKAIMALIGVKTFKDFSNVDYILSADLINYCMNRNIKG